jgi:hypothetical protein
MTISTSTRWTPHLHPHKRMSRCLNRLIQTPMVAGWSLLHRVGGTKCQEGLQEVSHRGKSAPPIRPQVTVMQAQTTTIALSTLLVHWITSRKCCLIRCKPPLPWVLAKEPLAQRLAPINPQLNQHLRRPHFLSTNSTWGRRTKIIRTLNCLLTFTMSNGTVLKTSLNSHQRRKSRTDSKSSTLPLSKTTLTQTSLTRSVQPQNPRRCSERLSWRKARE